MLQGKWRGAGKCQAIESEQVGTGWQDLGMNRNFKNHPTVREKLLFNWFKWS